MIKIQKATNERPRDRKRDRLILTIGQRKWHLGKDEALKLARGIYRIYHINGVV